MGGQGRAGGGERAALRGLVGGGGKRRGAGWGRWGQCWSQQGVSGCKGVGGVETDEGLVGAVLATGRGEAGKGIGESWWAVGRRSCEVQEFTGSGLRGAGWAVA